MELTLKEECWIECIVYNASVITTVFIILCSYYDVQSVLSPIWVRTMIVPFHSWDASLLFHTELINLWTPECTLSVLLEPLLPKYDQYVVIYIFYLYISYLNLWGLLLYVVPHTHLEVQLSHCHTQMSKAVFPDLKLWLPREQLKMEHMTNSCISHNSRRQH